MHRYLLNSATVVCLMGHTAVLTSVADGFLAVEATLFQVLIRQRLRYWPSVFRDVAFLHRPGAPQLDFLAVLTFLSSCSPRLKATVIGCVVACSPTLEDSYRRATQGPITVRGFTRISRAGNPKRPHPNCQAGPTASSTPLLLDAQMPWGGHPQLAADYLPPETVGQWLPAPCNGGP